MNSALLFGRFWRWLPLLVVLSWSPLHAAVPLVDLDKGRSLADLFRAGLRALRVWGLEDQECDIRPAVEASFRVNGLTIPAVKAEWEFSFNGKNLVKIKGISVSPWTAAEAYEAVNELETNMGGDAARMKAWLTGYPGTSANGEMWGRSVSKNDLKVAYYFRHSLQDVRPFLFTILIEWDFTQAEIVKTREPIQPPPGYEDFDMRPMSARGMDPVKGSTESGSPGETHESSSAKGGSKASTEPAARSESDGSPWPWLAALGLLLAAIAIWWRARQMA